MFYCDQNLTAPLRDCSLSTVPYLSDFSAATALYPDPNLGFSVCSPTDSCLSNSSFLDHSTSTLSDSSLSDSLLFGYPSPTPTEPLLFNYPTPAPFDSSLFDSSSLPDVFMPFPGPLMDGPQISQTLLDSPPMYVLSPVEVGAQFGSPDVSPLYSHQVDMPTGLPTFVHSPQPWFNEAKHAMLPINPPMQTLAPNWTGFFSPVSSPSCSPTKPPVKRKRAPKGVKDSARLPKGAPTNSPVKRRGRPRGVKDSVKRLPKGEGWRRKGRVGRPNGVSGGEGRCLRSTTKAVRMDSVVSEMDMVL
ncbi:hypothetical protein P280DRAFT_514593 [Massarina eburnea CBS 473.64]|uniref:Uncharacterized protein n=1 Tax=Massarina eburnea CBS 473.64 TaxID=1395130 RepID=A0A6A6SFX6_9PLEO|nr:hypothetical protein P280DRAFT_514593 [Massarina eburnea CBS 473.64]